MTSKQRIKDIIKKIHSFLLSRINLDVYSPVQISVFKEYYGSDYGGYVVCPNVLTSKSIIYSFGLGDDISFDLELIKRHDCKVFAYDPSPETQEYLDTIKLPASFKYQKVALSIEDGELLLYPSPNERINYSSLKREVKKGSKIIVPSKKLITIMTENGHNYIDLLKIDIEGSEYEVLQDIIKSDIKITQLVIEFHYKFKEFKGKGVRIMKETLALLKESGFQIFEVSSGGIEYSFLNTRNLTQNKLESCLSKIK